MASEETARLPLIGDRAPDFEASGTHGRIRPTDSTHGRIRPASGTHGRVRPAGGTVKLTDRYLAGVPGRTV